MDNRGMKAVEFCAGNFDIIGSCNGITCLLDDGKRFSLWNFAIRRKLTLPTHSLVEIPFNNSCILVGFGFDPLTQDYKIVFNSLIYSVKMGSWCAIASPATAISDVESQACFFSGALHWVVTRNLSESPTIPPRYILTFNLSSHVFGMITLPESSWEIEQLTIINSLLAVVFSKDNDTWIWVRKESGNLASWSVISKVENVQFEMGKVLQTTPNDDLLFFVYIDDCYDVYNPETKEFSGFVELRDCGYFDIDMDMYQCMPKALNY